ncbi:hypothetical protein K402DRAFT_424008 [Aulographum hederae CBS 113979]|uniref:Uncharacterized protein n=1 Tax=Aulographum hederae CBS 113979 TaxID=1176131 RepID=A0A6G1GR47_9PEZI|nr:hypothetical protein K402DRAFT_424008 [Aulographum hederae CBS 113979]
MPRLLHTLYTHLPLALSTLLAHILLFTLLLPLIPLFDRRLPAHSVHPTADPESPDTSSSESDYVEEVLEIWRICARPFGVVLGVAGVGDLGVLGWRAWGRVRGWWEGRMDGVRERED